MNRVPKAVYELLRETRARRGIFDKVVKYLCCSDKLKLESKLCHFTGRHRERKSVQVGSFEFSGGVLKRNGCEAAFEGRRGRTNRGDRSNHDTSLSDREIISPPILPNPLLEITILFQSSDIKLLSDINAALINEDHKEIGLTLSTHEFIGLGSVVFERKVARLRAN